MSDVVYEFYASASGLEPRYFFTLQQHQEKLFNQQPDESMASAARGTLGANPSAWLNQYVGNVAADDLSAVQADALLHFYDPYLVETFKNLLTNPSFETGAGTVEVRRNHFLRPQEVVDGTSSASNWLVISQVGTPPGLYYGSYEITNNRPEAISRGIRIWDNIEYQTGGTKVIEPGETVTLGMPFEVRSEAPYMQFRVYGGETGENLGVSVSRFLIAAGSSPVPYSDGDFSPDPDLTPSWTGTANASESVLTGVRPAGASTSSSVAVGIQSTRWKSSGAVSLRQVPMYGARGSAYTEFASHLNPLGLQVGKTYTVMAKFYQEQVQPVSYSIGRSITVATTPYSAQAPNVVGESIVRLVFTVPAGSWYLRLYNGGMVGDPDCWWDDILLVEGEYTGPWFSGSNNPDPRNATVVWDGTPNASTSTMNIYSD